MPRRARSPARRTRATSPRRRSPRSRARRFPLPAAAKPPPPLFAELRRAYAQSFGQVHLRQLVPDVPELREERVVDQPAHHLDRRALRADHVPADRALYDLEVAHAPHRHTLVDLDALLGEVVEVIVLAPLRVDLDERQSPALTGGVELLAEHLRDAAQLLEAGRVEAAAVAEHLANLREIGRASCRKECRSRWVEDHDKRK